jgi:hypothetical protein
MMLSIIYFQVSTSEPDRLESGQASISISLLGAFYARLVAKRTIYSDKSKAKLRLLCG